MPGVVYDFVKEFENHFLYVIIKYTPKEYSPTTSSNKVELVVAPIQEFERKAFEYRWSVPFSTEEKEDKLKVFANVCRTQFKMWIDFDVFNNILSELEIGDDLKKLKNLYRDEIQFRKKSLQKKEQKQRKQVIREAKEREKQVLKEEQKRRKQVIREAKEREKQVLKEEQKRRKQVIEEEKEQERRVKEEIEIEKARLKIREKIELLDDDLINKIRIIESKYEIHINELREKRKERGHVCEINERIKDLLKQKKAEEETIIGYGKARHYDTFRAFIGKPCIRRYAESPKGVFDYIELDVGLSMLAMESEVIPLLKKYRSRIDKEVIESIQTNKNFKECGVPVNYIKIDKISFNRKTRTLRYLLSCKL